MDKIKADLKIDGTGKVLLNGEDVSSKLIGMTITAKAGQVVTARLDLVDETEIEAEVEMLPKLEKKEEVIQIEICRSEYMKDRFNLRIGDIQGSSESSNFSKEEILRDISDEIDELKEKKYD